MVGIGRAAHSRLGLEGQIFLLQGGGQDVRLLRAQRTRLQRSPCSAQVIQALHSGETRAGMRNSARDREEVAALPRRQAGSEVGAGQSADRRDRR